MYEAYTELAIMACLYAWLAPGTVSLFWPDMRKARRIGYPEKLLVCHTVANILLIARYYTQLALSPWDVKAHLIDVPIAIVQILTSWLLTWTTSRRSPFQAASFRSMVLISTIAAGFTLTDPSPDWYRAYVKFLEVFVWFRVTLRVASKYRIFGYPRVPLDAIAHLTAVPMALSTAKWSGAVPIYFASLALLTKFDGKSAKQTAMDERGAETSVPVKGPADLGQEKLEK